jgi:hypothetical protein
MLSLFSFLRKRKVIVWDKGQDREIPLMTNHRYFESNTLSKTYKDIWYIESFFKALRKNLQVKNFVGAIENAIFIQIWTAGDHRRGPSSKRMICIEVFLFSRWPAHSVLAPKPFRFKQMAGMDGLVYLSEGCPDGLDITRYRICRFAAIWQTPNNKKED